MIYLFLIPCLWAFWFLCWELGVWLSDFVDARHRKKYAPDTAELGRQFDKMFADNHLDR